MIGLFSFDGPMYKDCNGVYCNTTITSEMFKRYFSVVDRLIVVIRTFELDTTYIKANMKEVNLEGLEIIEIGNLNSPLTFLSERKKYTKIIEENVEKADLIFARMPSVISDITLEIARKSEKKYLVEVGGCAWDAYWNHSIIGKIVAPYMYYQEIKNIRKSQYAIYVTQNWLQNRYPSKGITASASNVYLKEVNDQVLTNRYEKILKRKNNDPFIVGTTAAIDVKYKGQSYVIKAISNLNRKGYNFQYQLVGGGNDKYLKGLSSKLNVLDKVAFKGLMIQDDVINWLDEIDLYVQPSKQEGLPRALVEALSRACPAIGSTTAGIPELLNKNNIFKSGSVKEIEKLLLEKLNNKNQLLLDAEENFNTSKQFNIEKLNEIRKKIFIKYKKNIISERV